MSRRRLEGRLIALGVTGSIAAYKAVELLRLLRAEGADVVVMLTPSRDRGSSGRCRSRRCRATRSRPTSLDLLPDGRIGHIVVADTADAIVVAPATAHWLGAMANGLAGDVVTATALATQRAGRRRAGDGRRHVDAPGDRSPTSRGCATPSATRSSSRQSGPLASGPVRASGRLAELPDIVDAVVAAVADATDPASRMPAARPPLVGPAARARPAGATSSSPPAARASRSTRCGSSATARPGGWASRSPRPRSPAARGSRWSRRPSRSPLPDGATSSASSRTAELRDALRGSMRADRSRRRRRAGHGRRRRRLPAGATAATQARARRGGLTLELEPTPDILAEIAGSPRHRRTARRRTSRSPRPVLVGFAAETGSLDRAADKLRREGRRPARRQRRRRGGLRLRDRHQPGHDPRSPTAARDELPLLPKREVADRHPRPGRARAGRP